MLPFVLKSFNRCKLIKDLIGGLELWFCCSLFEEIFVFILLLYVGANKPSRDNSVFNWNLVCLPGWKHLLRWSWSFWNHEVPPSWLSSTSLELSFFKRNLRSNFWLFFSPLSHLNLRFWKHNVTYMHLTWKAYQAPQFPDSPLLLMNWVVSIPSLTTNVGSVRYCVREFRYQKLWAQTIICSSALFHLIILSTSTCISSLFHTLAAD